MSEHDHLNLVPALFEEGQQSSFAESGQTLSYALSPRSNTLACFATPSKIDPKSGAYPAAASEQEEDVYTAAFNRAPSGERRVFITDTSVIFAACRHPYNQASVAGPELMRSAGNIAAFRKLANDYAAHTKDCWVHATQLTSSPEGPPHFPGDHYRMLYTALSFFIVLYLPEDGVEDVPVGDELLEWLNIHFIEPSTEEGDQLGSLQNPWEDELFWPYILRSTIRCLVKSSTFLLRTLERHPSDNLRQISERLVNLLEKHPRQQDYTTEKDFFAASRRWREKAKVLRLELDRIPDHDRHDGFENWWNKLSDLLGILEGREEALKNACVELGAGWKEIICAYGVWIDVGLRRAELPDVVGNILTDVSPDPTDSEDVLYAELAQGRISKALTVAHEIDVWLVAHMADMMAPLGLIDLDVDDETGFSIRDFYVISYANYLHADGGLWRLAVDYMCTCGDIGKEMADEVILRVPLKFVGSSVTNGNARKSGDAAQMDDQIETGDLSEIMKELNATCYEYDREPVRRMICRIAAQCLTRNKKYSLAVSYCRSAEDWPGLGRIVDLVMEEYIAYGPSQYISYVSGMAQDIQELRAETGLHGVFVHRLMFAVRFAEYHRRRAQGDFEHAALDLMSMFEEELAPRSWWGVLLIDATAFLQDENCLPISTNAACLLLQRLEEVNMMTAQGSGEDYLAILARVLCIKDANDACKQLDALRLALARYYARSTLASSTALFKNDLRTS